MTEEDTFKALCRIPMSELIKIAGSWHRFLYMEVVTYTRDTCQNEKEDRRSKLWNKIPGLNFQPIYIASHSVNRMMDGSFPTGVEELYKNTGWTAQDHMQVLINEEKKKAEATRIAKKKRFMVNGTIAFCLGILGALIGIIFSGYGMIAFIITGIISFILGLISPIFVDKIFPYPKDGIGYIPFV